MPTSPPQATATATQSAPPAPVPHPGREGVALRSTDLLGNQPSVAIEHKGQIYRLQATRQGKLILTK